MKFYQYIDTPVKYCKTANISPPEYKPPYSLTQISFRILAPQGLYFGFFVNSWDNE